MRAADLRPNLGEPSSAFLFPFFLSPLFFGFRGADEREFKRRGKKVPPKWCFVFPFGSQMG
jgi:hypothetical protein